MLEALLSPLGLIGLSFVFVFIGILTNSAENSHNPSGASMSSGLFDSGLYHDDDCFRPFESHSTEHAINPANGFPMVGGTGGVDVGGNPYGSDFSHDDMFDTGSSFDDSYSSSVNDSLSSFDNW